MRLAGLIALALAGTLAPAASVSAQDIAISLAPGEVLLKVEAEGVYRARPDLMSVSAGVVTTGRSAKDALAANANLANRLLAAVRASGVEPRDVQTADLQVQPQFAGNRDEDAVRRITGYVARNRLNVTLRDLARAPAIIDGLFQAGANEVEGPTFGFADPAPALGAARVAAVNEAKAEAETYAAALGMRVTRVLRVSERRDFVDNDGGEIVVTGSRISGTPVEPGEIATRVTVWIDYAMAPIR
ncbi:MAG TPA: SIMPL domain-containing protein [Allosphingosinicella sp.]|jgi:hypothetical protein